MTETDEEMREVIGKTLLDHQKKRFAFRNAESGDLFDCTCGRRYTNLSDHQADELERTLKK